MAGRVRVYIATSLDGFIAGPDGDLSWLMGPDAANPGGETDEGALTWEAFFGDVGALLMGRGTCDAVREMDAWAHYGDRPVLVATHRPLGEGVPETVRPVSGAVEAMVAEAREAAGGRDVYVDGGDLVRQAVDAGLVDEITITVAPVALGDGIPLFAGLARRVPVEIVGHHTFAGGMVQIRARPRRG